MRAKRLTSGAYVSPVPSSDNSAAPISLRSRGFLSLNVREQPIQFLHELHIVWELGSLGRWIVTTRLWKRPRYRRFFTIYVLAKSARLKKWSEIGVTTSASAHRSTTARSSESSSAPGFTGRKPSRRFKRPQT